MVQIKDGGQLEKLSGEKTVKKLGAHTEVSKIIQFWINDESLSLLSIEEAVALRDELNNAIKEAVGV